MLSMVISYVALLKDPITDELFLEYFHVKFVSVSLEDAHHRLQRQLLRSEAWVEDRIYKRRAVIREGTRL